jgi:arsenate reductase
MMPTAKTATLYWLPHCSTCQKAKAFLEAKGVTFTTIVDIKATPLSKQQVLALVEGIGSAEALFSKRAMKFRSLGLHEQTLSSEDLITHMSTEYTFIKRPVVVFEEDGCVFAGFSTKQYEQYFASIS